MYFKKIICYVIRKKNAYLIKKTLFLCYLNFFLKIQKIIFLCCFQKYHILTLFRKNHIQKEIKKVHKRSASVPDGYQKTPPIRLPSSLCTPSLLPSCASASTSTALLLRTNRRGRSTESSSC